MSCSCGRRDCMVDLQLLAQSVPITTKVVSWNPVHGDVYSIQLCDKACQRQVSGFLWVLQFPLSIKLTTTI